MILGSASTPCRCRVADCGSEWECMGGSIISNTAMQVRSTAHGIDRVLFGRFAVTCTAAATRASIDISTTDGLVPNATMAAMTVPMHT